METLRSIAALAGVHVATASAVLNPARGNTRVSAETRQRVEAAAKKLSYVPNESARRLRTGQSDTVAFLGGDLRNPFFAEFTVALEAELSRRGRQLTVSHVVHAEAPTMAKAILSLQNEGISKIVRWEEAATPITRRRETLSIGFTRQEQPGVWLDLEVAVHNAVAAMLARGFRRLGFFMPEDQAESPSVVDRRKTFLEVCRRLGLTRPQTAAYRGESWDLVASVHGAKNVLKAHPQVEAWIGFNDIAALGLLRGLPLRASKRVVCFDGTVLARCWPGQPLHLDLGIKEFAHLVADAVEAKRDRKILGRRANWLRPVMGT